MGTIEIFAGNAELRPGLVGERAHCQPKLGAFEGAPGAGAGVEGVQFATISGRAFALDSTADDKALALVRNAMVDADPQTRDGLGQFIDAQNRGGINDGDITPMADIAYPGMRGDDALLVLHPQAEGMTPLLRTLLPEGGLTIPASRPVTLSACRRVIGWPQSAPPSLPASRNQQGNRSCVDTAIDGEFRPRHSPGVRTGQPGDKTGDFRRLIEPPDRHD